MPFYDDLAGTDVHADLVLAVRIEGVPTVFVERAIPAAVATSLSGYTQFVGITRLEEGEAVLDLVERRELAATLDVELLDDDAGTLAKLFAVNTRRRTYLTANATLSATALTLQSTTGLANGQTIYTDAETITIGTVASGTSLTGCTRGAFGSTAAALFGTASDGDSIYTVPPSWVARRAYLYGYTLDANGGGSEQLLGTWIVDEPPRCLGDDTWSMRFASVAQEIYERAVGVGLKTANVIAGSAVFTTGTRWTATYTVDDATGFRLGTSFPTYVIVEGETESSGEPTDSSGYAICELQAVDTTAGAQKVTFYVDSVFFSPDSDYVARFRTTKIRPIAFVGPSSGAVLSLLYVLLSKEGQGATTYDRLPGRLPSGPYDAGWRLGAGLTSSEVLITSGWEAVETMRSSTIIIDTERKVSELLAEWCLLNNMATRITADGKLAPFSLAPPRVSSSTSLGPNSVIPDSRIEVEADESAIFPLGTVKCGYNPFSREFNTEINLIDVYLAKRYQRNQQRRELEFRSIGCSDGEAINQGAPSFYHPAPLTTGEIGAIGADILRGDNGLARRYVSLSLTMAHLALRIGDVVTLSSALPDAFSTLPDLRGGTLAGAQARVVSRRPRYDAGRVDVRLLILDPLLLVSPGAAISSLVGSTLTLSTTGPEVSGSSPANDFYANVNIRIYDVSAGVVHNTTVSSITSGTQLVVAAAPAFAGGIEAGVDYIVADVSASTVSGTSVSGYSVTEWAALGNDVGVVSTTVGTTEPRWR